jgi:hypothetical protein
VEPDFFYQGSEISQKELKGKIVHTFGPPWQEVKFVNLEELLSVLDSQRWPPRMEIYDYVVVKGCCEPNVQKHIAGLKIKTVVYIPGKLINFVVEK